MISHLRNQIFAFVPLWQLQLWDREEQQRFANPKLAPSEQAYSRIFSRDNCAQLLQLRYQLDATEITKFYRYLVSPMKIFATIAHEIILFTPMQAVVKIAGYYGEVTADTKFHIPKAANAFLCLQQACLGPEEFALFIAQLPGIDDDNVINTMQYMAFEMALAPVPRLEPLTAMLTMTSYLKVPACVRHFILSQAVVEMLIQFCRIHKFDSHGVGPSYNLYDYLVSYINARIAIDPPTLKLTAPLQGLRDSVTDSNLYMGYWYGLYHSGKAEQFHHFNIATMTARDKLIIHNLYYQLLMDANYDAIIQLNRGFPLQTVGGMPFYIDIDVVIITAKIRQQLPQLREFLLSVIPEDATLTYYLQQIDIILGKSDVFSFDITDDYDSDDYDHDQEEIGDRKNRLLSLSIVVGNAKANSASFVPDTPDSLDMVSDFLYNIDFAFPTDEPNIALSNCWRLEFNPPVVQVATTGEQQIATVTPAKVFSTRRIGGYSLLDGGREQFGPMIEARLRSVRRDIYLVLHKHNEPGLHFDFSVKKAIFIDGCLSAEERVLFRQALYLHRNTVKDVKAALRYFPDVLIGELNDSGVRLKFKADPRMTDFQGVVAETIAADEVMQTIRQQDEQLFMHLTMFLAERIRAMPLDQEVMYQNYWSILQAGLGKQ